MSATFDRWLIRELTSRGWTHRRLAEQIDVGRSVVTGWVNGVPPVKIGDLLALERVLDTHRYLLLDLVVNAGGDRDRMDGDAGPIYDMIPLPLYLVGEPVDRAGRTADPRAFLWDAPFPIVEMTDYFGLLMVGDDLSPDVNDGEVAVVHRGGQVLPGSVACVLIDGRYALRRVVRRAHSYVLTTNADPEGIPWREVETCGVVMETHQRRVIYPPAAGEGDR